MRSDQRQVWAVAAHVALSGGMWGLDTGSIGPVTQMTQFRASIGYLSPTKQGAYVACLLLSAAVSALASGHVSDHLSRKYGMFGGGVIILLGTIVSACSHNLAALFVARLLTGVGVGQAMSIAAVYLVEIPPADIRGKLASLLQLYVVTGIAVGYFIPFGSRNLHGSLAWRTPFIFQAALAFFYCGGLLLMPFSPRWLYQKNRKVEARVVLGRLREPQVVDKELNDIEATLTEDKMQQEAHFMEMFQRRYLRRTLLSIFILVGIQTTGIDAVFYFAPLFFQQAGLSSEMASFLASGVTGLVMVLFTLPAQIWLDKWGRRKPLVIGGTAVALCFVIIGSIYAALGFFKDGDPALPNKATQWTVIVLIYLYVANYAWSWASVGRVYTNEIIPTRLRAKVCAVGQLANWVVNFVVAFTAPSFLRSSLGGLYFFYGFVTLFAAFICIFVPETKGRSLEEIEGLFEPHLHLRDGDRVTGLDMRNVQQQISTPTERDKAA